VSDRKPIQRFHQVLCVGVPTNGASAGWRVHVVNQRITLGSCSCCLRPIKCISGLASVVASWLSAIVMLSPTCHVQQVQTLHAKLMSHRQNALHSKVRCTPSCKLVASFCHVSTRSDEPLMSISQVHARSWQNVKNLSYQKGCH